MVSVNINSKTGYSKVIVSNNDYFEELLEKFDVIERKHNKVVFICENVETEGNLDITRPKLMKFLEKEKDNIDYSSLKVEYIQWHKNLPDNYRDNKKYQAEISLMEPDKNSLSKKEGISILKCIRNTELSSNSHKKSREKGIKRVKELVQEDIKFNNTLPNSKEVSIALNSLRREGVYPHFNNHKNNILLEIRRSIHNESQIDSSSVPEPEEEHMYVL